MKKLMLNGFFLLPRGWREHIAFPDEPMSSREVWVWMIEQAQFSNAQFKFRKKVITLKRGQLAYSYEKLAEIWGWHRSRVQRYVNRLQSGTLIDTDTGMGILVITICNYEEIQTPQKAIGTAIGTFSDTVIGTPIGNIRNKEKEGKEIPPPIIPPHGVDSSSEKFDFFWKVYPHRAVPEGKAGVFKKWKRAKIEEQGKADEVILGVQSYAQTQKAKMGFAINPKKFLQDEVWKTNGRNWTSCVCWREKGGDYLCTNVICFGRCV